MYGFTENRTHGLLEAWSRTGEWLGFFLGLPACLACAPATLPIALEVDQWDGPETPSPSVSILLVPAIPTRTAGALIGAALAFPQACLRTALAFGGDPSEGS